MKKLISFLTLLTIFGCSSDDNNSETTPGASTSEGVGMFTYGGQTYTLNKGFVINDDSADPLFGSLIILLSDDLQIVSYDENTDIINGSGTGDGLIFYIRSTNEFLENGSRTNDSSGFDWRSMDIAINKDASTFYNDTSINCCTDVDDLGTGTIVLGGSGDQRTIEITNLSTEGGEILTVTYTGGLQEL